MSKRHPSHGPLQPSRASYTARIVAHTPPHSCGSLIANKLLAIIDLDRSGCRSVTNAIEGVLHELRPCYGGDLPSVIVYRDTTGVWDGVAHIEGMFQDFYPIRETDFARAIDKALARGQAAARPSAAYDALEPR